jgi:hypothetical protein
MIKKILFLSVIFVLSGCNEKEVTSSIKTESEKSYALSYSDEFTEVFKIPNKSPTELPSGVDALKAYTLDDKYGTSFLLQIYIQDSINLYLKEQEKTLLASENSGNGFLDFSEAEGFLNQQVKARYLSREKEESDKFGARAISYSKNLAATLSFRRYSKNVISGYTLIELSLPGPDVEAIYLYTGDELPTKHESIIAITDKLVDSDDLSEDGYLKIGLPQEIQKFYMDNCGSLCPP